MSGIEVGSEGSRSRGCAPCSVHHQHGKKGDQDPEPHEKDQNALFERPGLAQDENQPQRQEPNEKDQTPGRFSIPDGDEGQDERGYVRGRAQEEALRLAEPDRRPDRRPVDEPRKGRQEDDRPEDEGDQAICDLSRDPGGPASEPGSLRDGQWRASQDRVVPLPSRRARTGVRAQAGKGRSSVSRPDASRRRQARASASRRPRDSAVLNDQNREIISFAVRQSAAT